MAQLLPRAFDPSGLDGEPVEEYGYNDDPIAAQTMLTTYRAGMDVGDLGNYGIFDKLFKGGAKTAETASGAATSGGGAGIAVDAVVGLTTAAIGAGAALAQGKKQRDHEAAMMQAEADLIAQQQQLAAMQGEGGTSPWVWLLGGTVVLGMVGGGIYLATRKK